MNLACSRFLIAAVLVMGSAGAVAGQPMDDPQIVSSQAFIDAHPDLRLRRSGEEAYRGHQYRSAFGYFKDASRYAEKGSQAMVAQMLWKGEGVKADRPLAYAWMDLAAERGYRDLLALREGYWSALDESERKRAVEVGQAVYDEFGDAVAKPRLEKVLARTRQEVTGSHLGHVGTLKIPGAVTIQKGSPLSGISTVSGSDFVKQTDGSRYYAADYWDAKQYWRWQDLRWQEGSGRVEVGELRPVAK